MARKDPKDLTVEEKLKALFQLQSTLSQIDEKRALRGELPLEVEDLENEVEGLSVRLDKITQEIEDLRNAVKQSLEIELCAKKIREAEQRIIDREHDKERVEELINDRERDLEDKRGELDEIMQETREEEDILKAKAKDLELKIETRLLQSFKRIRKNARNGLGIVYVQRDACGGCFNKIPPQRQLDVKMHKKIIVCEHCGRILIDPELAGVKVEAATPEKPKRKSVRRKKAEE